MISDDSYEELESLADEDEEEKVIDVEALVKKARRDRKIEESEVQAILASTDEEQADKLYEQLQRLGIQIVSESGEIVEDLGDASSLLETDLLVEDETAQESSYQNVTEDDPVHTYLKEIGLVPLLTAEQEIWLASQLAAASTLESVTTKVLETDGRNNIHARTMMANYQALLDSWQRATQAGQVIDVPLPDLGLIIQEAQNLRKNWQSSSPSYLRHYLNEGEWGQAEEWSEMARSVFAIFTTVYLMPTNLSDQMCDFYI